MCYHLVRLDTFWYFCSNNFCRVVLLTGWWLQGICQSWCAPSKLQTHWDQYHQSHQNQIKNEPVVTQTLAFLSVPGKPTCKPLGWCKPHVKALQWLGSRQESDENLKREVHSKESLRYYEVCLIQIKSDQIQLKMIAVEINGPMGRLRRKQALRTNLRASQTYTRAVPCIAVQSLARSKRSKPWYAVNFRLAE